MPILTPYKALRSLKKTPIILQKILAPVTQAMAQTIRDGDDGWSILYIMCHLYDYQQIYFDRMTQMLEQDNPTFTPTLSNEALIVENRYQDQHIQTMLEGYITKRQQYLQLLENLADEQWQRTGVHERVGSATVLEHAINTALHDVDHIGQIVQALGDES